MGAKLTRDIFITRSNKVHNSLYDYSKAYYENNSKKVVIICKIHGEFLQSPDKHMSGQGCPKCSNSYKSTTSRFIATASSIHNNKYSYVYCDYITNTTPVIIVCNSHGNFLQTPKSHLIGHGCPKCAGNTPLTNNTFIDMCISIHGSTYGYSNTKYIKSAEKVVISCREHGDFLQLPHNHLNGQGCPSCANHGFDKSKPAILYYLKVSYGNQVVYKIGITNRTIDARFSIVDLEKIEVIFTEYFELGSDAYSKEQKILEEFKEYKYKGEPILSSGNTELFTEDILKKGTK